MLRMEYRSKPDSYKFNKILKIVLSIFIITIGYSVMAPAFAQSGLVVSPTLLEFDSRQRFATLTLVNRGVETKTYRISAINRKMLVDGQFIPTETPAAGEGFADPYLRFSPRQIALDPGVPQTVRVMLRLPRDMESKEYRSHLLFEQVPDASEAMPVSQSAEGLGMQIVARFGLSIPVFIYHGELTASAELSDLKPITREDGSKAIALTVNRSGTKSLRGDLIVTQNSQQIGILRNLAVYLSTEMRRVQINVDPDILTDQKLTIEYRARAKDGGALFDSKTISLQ